MLGEKGVFTLSFMEIGHVFAACYGHWLGVRWEAFMLNAIKDIGLALGRNEVGVGGGGVHAV